MNVVARYECGICKTEYKTADSAGRCEDSHRPKESEFGVSNLRVSKITDPSIADEFSVLPREIYISTGTGFGHLYVYKQSDK